MFLRCRYYPIPLSALQARTEDSGMDTCASTAREWDCARVAALNEIKVMGVDGTAEP